MLTELRQTGIAAVGEVPWGTHLCQFYETREDLIDILVPYFKTGLENNEFCMWVASAPLGVEDAKQSLTKVVTHFDEYIEKGQMKILDASRWYTRTGKFDAANVLRGWVRKHDQALKKGFAGIRVAGNAFWLEKSDWRGFAEYEAAVDGVIGGYRMLAICSYPLQKCGASEIIDVVANHPFALVRRAGKWEMVQSARRRRAEEALERRTHELGERVKELNCLYSVARVVEEPGVSLEELLRRTVNLLPPAWQYPEVTAARITFEGRTFTAGDFRETPWKQTAEIVVHGEPVGTVEVCYLSEKPEGDEGPFLKEERSLINAVAERLGRIVERKQAEENLRQNEGKLNAMLSSIGDHMSMMDRGLNIIWANETVKKTFGDDLIGRKCYEVYHRRKKPCVPYPCLTLKAFQDGQVHELDTEVISREGRILCFHCTANVALRDKNGEPAAVIEISRDITDRKRTQEDARRMARAVEQSIDGIAIGDMEPRLMFVNDSFARMHGYSPQEMVGMQVANLHNAEQTDEYRMAIKQIKTKGWWRGEIGHVTKDGAAFPTYMTVTLLKDDEGRPTGILAVARDITERKRAEEESRTLARLGARLAGAETVESMITAVREETDHLLEWDAHYFAVRRREEDTFHVVSFVDTVSGRKTTFRKENWRASDLSPAVAPVLEGRPVLINRAPGDPRPVLSPFGDEDHISASLMHVPVRSGENVIGILSVQSYTYGRYKEGDLQTLHRIADAIAPALERAHAAESLRHSEEKYRSLIENLPQKIFLKDTDSVYLSCNENYARDLKIKPPEIAGKTDYDFHPKELAEKYRADDRRIMASGRAEDIEEKYVQDGQEVIVHTVKTPVRDEQGNCVGLLGIFWDITDRKRAEEEKQQLQEQLAHAQKMEALGTLAGGIAHEFNNVNAAIIGYSDLTLQTEELSTSARRNLDVIRSSAVRGASLTKSLLAFSRSDVGERGPVELKNVVDEVLSVTAKEFTSEGIEVIVRHSTRVPPVLGDAGMLASVVMNLVVNARHAMLDSPLKKLTVQTGLEKGRAFIKVRDTGCGIPKKDIARVFEPFFTTKGSLASGRVFDGKARGTGLGLSVCHSIIEGHGGEINVRSQVGRGSTFAVYLPPAPEHKAARPEVREGRKEGAARILVVDDEQAITDLLVDILVQGGHAADGFTNPREALRALRQEQYSLAFVDLQMPEMPGEALVRAIDRLPPERRPLTVILTGRLDVSESRFRRLGTFAWLTKPFSNQEVLAIAERGLAARTSLPRKDAE